MEAVETADSGGEFVEGGEDVPGVREQHAAEGGGASAVPATVENGAAEGLLDALQLCGESGLGQAQRRSGSGHTPGRPDGVEVAKVADFQLHLDEYAGLFGDWNPFPALVGSQAVSF